jgi:hypothetical protein
LSELAEASVFPDRLQTTAKTTPVCPLRVSTSCPVLVSQNRMVESPLPDASSLPSALKATE